MSRILTPFNASIGSSLLPGGARVQARDAPALGAGGLVDHRVDEGRLARADGLFHRFPELRRIRRVHAHAAEGLDYLVIARALHEHRGGNVGAARRVHVRALVDAVVVHHHYAHRQVVAADGLHFHAGEAEGAVAFDRDHLLSGHRSRCHAIPHADAHDAPGADVYAFAGPVHVD